MQIQMVSQWSWNGLAIGSALSPVVANVLDYFTQYPLSAVAGTVEISCCWNWFHELECFFLKYSECNFFCEYFTIYARSFGDPWPLDYSRLITIKRVGDPWLLDYSRLITIPWVGTIMCRLMLSHYSESVPTHVVPLLWKCADSCCPVTLKVCRLMSHYSESEPTHFVLLLTQLFLSIEFLSTEVSIFLVHLSLCLLKAIIQPRPGRHLDTDSCS